MSETLRETAEREVQKAEQDLAALRAKEQRKANREKAAKPNGKANGVTHEGSSSTSEEAPKKEEQASAPPPAPGAPTWDRAPSQKEIARAETVLQELRHHAHSMGAEAVIDGLLQIVQYHPSFRAPDEWPGDAEDELCGSEVLDELVGMLCRGCPKLAISPDDVVALLRNKKTWTKRGVVVKAEAKTLSPLASFLSGGRRAVLMVNYQDFKIRNPQQRVSALYKALRKLSAEGQTIPAQFEGFYDEVELFGTGTWSEDAHLVTAISRAAKRSLPFAQLDAFAEPATA